LCTATSILLSCEALQSFSVLYTGIKNNFLSRKLLSGTLDTFSAKKQTLLYVSFIAQFIIGSYG
jgi:hypothetical protein